MNERDPLDAHCTDGMMYQVFSTLPLNQHRTIKAIVSVMIETNKDYATQGRAYQKYLETAPQNDIIGFTKFSSFVHDMSGCNLIDAKTRKNDNILLRKIRLKCPQNVVLDALKEGGMSFDPPE